MKKSGIAREKTCNDCKSYVDGSCREWAYFSDDGEDHPKEIRDTPSKVLDMSPANCFEEDEEDEEDEE